MEQRIKLKKVDDSVMAVFERLIQYYECEFSSITGKKPDCCGLFHLDINILSEDITAWLAYVEDIPAAMAVIKNHGCNHFEICEFFVIPYWRRHRLGTELAAMIWRMHPGKWEIKQIQGADYAVSFWREAVSEFTGNRYTEDVFDDRNWGTVSRQCFENIQAGTYSEKS